jgi:hypothetical protein
MSDFMALRYFRFKFDILFLDCDHWIHQFEDYVEKIEIIQQFQNTRASSAERENFQSFAIFHSLVARQYS